MSCETNNRTEHFHTHINSLLHPHTYHGSALASHPCLLQDKHMRRTLVHSSLSLRIASTSQWLSLLLNFVFGKENKNLLFYRRHSILKWFSILLCNIWSHSAELDLPISPFCESFLHLPNPVYCLFPVALQEAQINIFFKIHRKLRAVRTKLQCNSERQALLLAVTRRNK